MEIGKNTRRRKEILDTFSQIQHEAGKLPPQAIDLEEAVLGSLMLDTNALTETLEVLREESFYMPEHVYIFSAIKNLFKESQPVDILTVVNELKRNGNLEVAGGAAYISRLTSRIANTSNVEFHARILVQKEIQRNLIAISSGIIKDAYDDQIDAFRQLDGAQQRLFEISEQKIKRNFLKISDLISKAKKQIETAANLNEKNEQPGVPTGFNELDKMTSGWQKSDLIILAARPAMGKTAFVLSLARNAAVQYNRPVAFFSLEMSSIQLVMRLISSETELAGEKLRKGNLANHEWHQLDAQIRQLSEAPLFIDDTPALSILELKAKARRLKTNHNISMVIIDYLQLMTAEVSGKNGNREQEISTISRSLKVLAKELDIPVIALSQLSRDVEKRSSNDKVPQLSDLRESGAIEQDADMVMFIYRPEYYKIYQDENGNNLEGVAEIHIAKHRNGSIGKVSLKFNKEFSKFENLEMGGGFNFLAPNEGFESPTRILPSKMNNSSMGESNSFEVDDEVTPF